MLIASVTTYMGLLDLGIRGAVTRFVSRDHARGNHEAASAAVAAALWTRQWIGLGLLVLNAVVAAQLDRIFDLPPARGSAASGCVKLTWTPESSLPSQISRSAAPRRRYQAMGSSPGATSSRAPVTGVNGTPTSHFG